MKKEASWSIGILFCCSFKTKYLLNINDVPGTVLDRSESQDHEETGDFSELAQRRFPESTGAAEAW